MRIIPFYCIIILFTIFLCHLSSCSIQDVESASRVSASWKCWGCRFGVEALGMLYQQNATASTILSVANYICRHFADQDSFVCRGITSQFQDEFLYVLGRLVFRPNQLCGLLLAKCGSPVDPFYSNWTVPLPPKPLSASPSLSGANGRRSPSSSLHHRHHPLRHRRRRSPLRILQLSDLHFDRDYLAGSEADCGEPVCCSRHVEKPKRRAGRWGTLAACDIPLRTLEHLLQHINRTHELDFALLSGDYMDHRDWAYSREGHLAAIENISALLQRHLPGVPVFWALGNHEGVPVNAFAPHFVPQRFQPRWMYERVLEEGRRTARLPHSVDQSAIYRGSYALELSPSLKLVSLNNGYCERTNMFIYINQTDPDGSLSWLVEQLGTAERAGQSVYILAHIPPGNSECLESWARNYYLIVQRFTDIIRAQFFGHTHTDSFSLFFADMDNPRSQPVSVLFTAPSVTTFEGLNPGYRVYSADPYSGELIDYESYFLNLTSALDDRPPDWELLYSAREEYGLSSLQPTEWNALAERIERDPEMAKKFNRNYVRRDDLPCDAKCLAKRLCEIRAAHHNEKALCGNKKSREEKRRMRKKKKIEEKGRSQEKRI